MKKQIASLLVMSIICSAPMAMAVSETTTTQEVKAPVWEEYVPENTKIQELFQTEGKILQNFLLVLF